ncbi:rCG52082 [Rattus norvegicus]|uniref:RCG52082 n=1 Tax=Rattus norvegicus TaxID=10116 RepID=A6K6H9_RAT|nr:rCG52082 [Rattus norvegicus]
MRGYLLLSSSGKMALFSSQASGSHAQLVSRQCPHSFTPLEPDSPSFPEWHSLPPLLVSVLRGLWQGLRGGDGSE